MQLELASLEKEMKVMSKLSHKNIVAILGRNETARPNSPMVDVSLVMEFCELDLAKLLLKRTKFLSVEAAVIIKSVLEGLMYLHDNNVIHRSVDV